MIEDNIWDLSLILLSVVVFFFPFGCPPLSNNSLFFVKFKQPETECLERWVIWSLAREKLKDKEKGGGEKAREKDSER